MASAQRSIFVLTASQDGPGVVTPSPARELAKGSQLLGAQIQVLFTLFQAPASFALALQGRNGDTDDDWVAIFQSAGVVDIDNPSFLLGGPDALVPVSQFAEVRLDFVQVAGVPADVADLQIICHCKTDYLTG